MTLEMFRQVYPPKALYSVDDIPDLSGRTMIVTGGNTGVGKEAVRALLAHNAKVYIAARSAENAKATIQELMAMTEKEAHFLKLDLANLSCLRLPLLSSSAERVNSMYYITTAGYLLPQLRWPQTTGHFYFTELLIPLLISTAKRVADGKARIVTTSSSRAYVAGKIDFETVKDGPARVEKGTKALYDQSKLVTWCLDHPRYTKFDAVVAAELARRYGDQGIVSVALNPGNLRPGMQRHLGPFEHFMVNLLLYPATMGALTQLRAGTSAEGTGFNGKFLIPWARIRAEPLKAMEDEKLFQQLWEWLEEQVKHV